MEKIQFANSTSKEETLQDPLVLRINKSKLQLQYALFYVKDFNAKPIERIVYRDDLLNSISQCKDGANEAEPTCGWVYDAKNSKIANSQGFCCSCSVTQVFGVSKEGTRGSLDCNLLAKRQSSAHCLRNNRLWYSAYQMNAAQKRFNITLTIVNKNTNQVLVC